MAELLVTMAISSIVTFTLFSLVGQSSESYQQAQRGVNAISQARAFIQFFERELSTRLPDTPLLYEKAGGHGAPASDRIAFFRTMSIDEQDPTNPGDINTSDYYLAYSADHAAAESPKLFRGVLKPAETQALLESGSLPGFPPVNPLTDEPMVPNVLSFTAQPKFFQGNPARPVDWTPGSPVPPTLIELTIRFIDDASAARFRTRADWERLATAPRREERKLIRTFTRTISIAK
jgi:hypothetical protein